MPTYSIEDDFEDSTGREFFKKWLFPSMKTFRKKRTAKSHRETILLGRQIKKRTEEVMSEVGRKFDEKKRKHMTLLEAKLSQTTVPELPKRSVDYEAYRRKWELEAENPSASASIIVEGIVTSSDEGQKTTKTVTVPLSNKTNVLQSTRTEPPKQSSIVEQAVLPQFSFTSSTPAASSTSATFQAPTLASIQKQPAVPAKTQEFTFGGSVPFSPISAFGGTKDLNLEKYDGARPSFAGQLVTSTPVKPSVVSVKPQLSTVPEASSVSSSANDLESQNEAKETKDAKVSQPEKKEPTSTTTTNMCSFYPVELEYLDDTELIRERLEKPEAFPLRSYLTRSLRDKIGVAAKRTATTEEITQISQYLLALITGKPVVGFNKEQVLELTIEDERRYAAHLIVKEYLSTVTRDSSLIDTSASILSRICLQNAEFEKFLLGRLLNSSILLRYDESECEKLATSLCSMSSAEERTLKVAKEKATASLFVQLHIKCSFSAPSTFQIGNLWRFAAFLVNSSARVLASSILLTVILENANSLMSKHYQRQWAKVLRLIKDSFVPSLEQSLRTSELRRKVVEICHFLEKKGTFRWTKQRTFQFSTQ
ncbi:hypothetical protein WR25_04460 isoform C [Diploscapter pachys]|uniref:Uncharacterized protein n=1 Tax=Diploscapter pachys TaxID=2018661 RepID=A0A2A2LZ13_9BILA|nr:hypothetical protein WR25_04460 isoform C [Diploscapter pachys]